MNISWYVTFVITRGSYTFPLLWLNLAWYDNKNVLIQTKDGITVLFDYIRGYSMDSSVWVQLISPYIEKEWPTLIFSPLQNEWTLLFFDDILISTLHGACLRLQY